MKSVIPALFLGFILLSAMHGETVMVDVSNGPESLYISEERFENAVALEDGVMELFFDNGHIVFNAGISVDRPNEMESDETESAMRIAKRGGASHLLAVRVGAPANKGELPKFVSYVFYRLSDDFVLSRGSLQLTDMPLDKNYSIQEICRIYGRRTAENALRSW